MKKIKNKKPTIKKRFFNKSGSCSGSYVVYCSKEGGRNRLGMNPYKYSGVEISIGDGHNTANNYINAWELLGTSDTKQTVASLRQFAKDIVEALDWLELEFAAAKEFDAAKKADKTKKKVAKKKAAKV